VKQRKTTVEVTDKKGLAKTKEKTIYDISYVGPDGKRITDADVLARIEALGIPPAYQRVWISPDTDAHVLAIGIDARGRPQYAYHPRWIEATAETKFARMAEFGGKISNIRRATETDLRSEGLNERKLLAAAAAILETGSIRVGSEKYVVENGSYGLTTLLHEHVKVSGPMISFDFTGKEGIPHKFSIENAEVAPIIAELLEGPGPRLFEYVDDAGQVRTVDANDIKKYLREISGGEPFTAKDYRTWQGTTAAARKLLELGSPASAKDAETKIAEAVTYASSILRNKPNTARENYIHALVLDAYAAGGNFQDIVRTLPTLPNPGGLKDEELLVLELLRRTKF
jgi:DNA topoisomerase-1